MENWKEYVAYQELPEGAQHGFIHYLWVNIAAISEYSPNQYVFNSGKAAVNHLPIIDEEAVRRAIIKVFENFPTVEITSEIGVLRAKIESVKKTRRGMPNVNYGPYWYYRGVVTQIDSPIIVVGSKIEGQMRYAVWTHPNIADYGFKISMPG